MIIFLQHYKNTFSIWVHQVKMNLLALSQNISIKYDLKMQNAARFLLAKLLAYISVCVYVYMRTRQ